MQIGLSVSDSSFGAAIFTPDGRPTAHTYVFYERVEKMAKKAPCSVKELLGSVMAHELGHLLLGRAHSPRGLMSRKWDRRALARVARGDLWFGDDEARRLQAAVGQLLLAAK